MAEAEALKAVAALKDATIIKTKKADWRLVAAAQAMLRGQHSDEFDAAQAFGKTIKQRREVSHWSDKLRELEQMRSLLLGVTTSGELSNAHSSSSLLVQPEWIEEHVLGVKALSASAPIPSPGKRHAKRDLSALSTPPGGSTQAVSGVVNYTFPPPEGEPDSAAKRRDDRHRRREERTIRSMDLSGALQEHTKAEATRHQSAREQSQLEHVIAPVDKPPYGLSADLLVGADWVAQQLPRIEQGSFEASDLQLYDERRAAAVSLEHDRLTPGERCALEQAVRLIDEGKVAAFTARRSISARIDDRFYRPLCGHNHFDNPRYSDEMDVASCGEPMQLMTWDGHDSAAVTAATAAWRAVESGEPLPETEELCRRAEQLLEEEDALDESWEPDRVLAFYRVYHGDDASRSSSYCDLCREPVPDAAVRWSCATCNDFECCLSCAESCQNFYLDHRVWYDLPPAAGESLAESKQRRKRHRDREEKAIMDMSAQCRLCC